MQYDAYHIIDIQLIINKFNDYNQFYNYCLSLAADGVAVHLINNKNLINQPI